MPTDKPVSTSLMLHSGILEEYWDKDFTDFYGHQEKRAELEPKLTAWNTRNAQYSDRQIRLDFDAGAKTLNEVMVYADHLANARKHGISLFLYGPNGTGKSLLSVSTLKAALRIGYRVQMTSLGGIIECYTDGWTNADRREAFNSRIKDVDFLLIDDVGKEYRSKSSDLVEVAFDNLIRYRTFRHKPFILTTNTDMTRLQNTYGKSLASLLMGRCYNIEVGGIDYRAAIQAKDITRLLKGG
jgi:DNA replication protein DnaC